MKARVTVRLKPSVLDPQGEAIERALKGLGFASVKNVRVGKLIELDVDGAQQDATALKRDLANMADKLLANPVIESYAVEVLDDATRAGGKP